MANYRSLVGGFYSATPLDKASGPTSIRSNNPGAINGAKWERTYPGYVDTVVTTPGNATTIFETPEQGIAAWWELLRHYRAAGATTVTQIISRYGGGQDYSAYVSWVVQKTGLLPGQVIQLDNDDLLLRFAKGMFQYEAGKKIPWSDTQIRYGIQLGRTYAGRNAALAPESITQGEGEMENTIPWWQSRVIIGGLVSVVAPIIGAVLHKELGLDVQGDLTNVLVSIAAGIGGLLAIYGRVVPNKSSKMGIRFK